jgi:PAS domain-containing protein
VSINVIPSERPARSASSSAASGRLPCARFAEPWPSHQINLKVDELKRTIDVRQNQGFDAARQIVETNVGADATRAIDQVIDAATAAEKSLLKNRQALGDEAERTTAMVSLIAGGLAFLIIIVGSILVTASFRRLSRSEQGLRESEERFRLMVSGIKDYAIFMLDPEGRLATWNQGAERIRLSSGGDHRPALLMFLPRRRLWLRRIGPRAPGIAEGSFSGEGWRVRKDGSEFWASVLITAIRDDRGNLRGFAKLTHDITERKQAEAALDRETEERERAEGILRQAQKMDVLASSALGGLDDREAGKANILGRGAAQ